MQISFLVTLLFASVLASSAQGVITPQSQAASASKAQTIPGNSEGGPGGKNINEQYPNEIGKWTYPDPKKLEPWPAQPKYSNRKECSLKVLVAVGSCKAGAYGNKPEFMPYDAPSTKAIEGKVSFNVHHEDGDYYDNTTVTLDCYWRGRVMITDTPEIQARIGLISVRIDTSPKQSRAWVTADPDPETQMKQNQIAPIGFVEFGGHKANNVNWSNARGFDKSLKTTTNPHDSLYIQVC